MANSKLTRTPSSTGNRQIHTISAWVKRSKLNYDYAYILTAGTYNSTQMVQLKWDSDNHLIYSGYNAGGGQEFRLESSKAYRDINGWYNVVVACDSTQGTASNRVKIYVNNEQVTAFDEASYPSSSYDSALNTQIIHTIGLRDGTSSFFEGYMSHVAVVDGTALTPATFGETDSTSGIWKFKGPSGVTWGTNGFHLKFENSGALGTDSSGNSNTFAVNGNLKQALDTPSNVYCTLNPLAVGSSAPTFSKGNNRVTGTANAYQFTCGTLEVPLNGKWYWEVKANNNVNGSSSEYLIGAVLESRLQASSDFAEFAADGITQYGSVGTGIGQNDIISVAVDRTAATLKIYKNNSLLFTKSSLPAEIIFPMVTVFGSGTGADSNFGNGYFGGTAISSAGSNGNGSLFEYDVPSGYYALNTKNINTYG